LWKQRDPGAGLFEQRVEVTVAGAVTQVHSHLELRFFDHGKVNELVELFEICGLRVKRFALKRADDRAFERPARRLKLGDVRFDLAGDFRVWRARR